MPKVFVIHPNTQYLKMFKDNGWDVVDELKNADLVQFTGGADVSPALYGEDRHPRTHSDMARDQREANAFLLAKKLGIPMAGICRGGQFLNIMCGGKMYQDVDRHAIGGTHVVVDTATGEVIPCTSTHHQMMIPAEDARLLGVASEATRVEKMVRNSIKSVKQKRGDDVEVLYYPDQKVLCFQPHPEYMGVQSECQQWYFSLIEKHLEVA